MRLSADRIRDMLAMRFELTRLEGFVGEVAITRAKSDVLEPERSLIPLRCTKRFAHRRDPDSALRDDGPRR